MALTVVELLAIGTAHCQTGERHRLASQGVSLLLEMEESALRRSPVCTFGSSESDSANEPRQPSLGSSAHSPGIAEDWNRGVAGHCRQIHGPATKPSPQTWRTVLKNHAKDLVSADFFVVPTIAFQFLFVFVILMTADVRFISV